jgi:hypothetical protein
MEHKSLGKSRIQVVVANQLGETVRLFGLEIHHQVVLLGKTVEALHRLLVADIPIHGSYLGEFLGRKKKLIVHLIFSMNKK